MEDSKAKEVHSHNRIHIITRDRYGTRSQGISQFYLHTPPSSANGMKHTCLCLPSRSWYSFNDPGGMDGWVGLGCMAGWFHTEINVRHRKLNPDTVAHLSNNRVRRWLTSLIKANALTTTPDHQPNPAEPGVYLRIIIWVAGSGVSWVQAGAVAKDTFCVRTETYSNWGVMTPAKLCAGWLACTVRRYGNNISLSAGNQ